MTPFHDFDGALAVARKSFKEIKEIVKSVYGDKALKSTHIYDIMKLKEEKPAVDREV
jgi:hypothetical protein